MEVSPSLKPSLVISAPGNPALPDSVKPYPENRPAGNPTHEGCLGYLDVLIHEARDIHNICIYHKQDVYAKLSLTADPDSPVSTQTINGGGRNPVFNQTLRLSVKTLDSSLRCEIWMLSRVRNYLEDQPLGFALVPLSDVVTADGGRLAGEFSLSSTDLFHSHAGFVRLSISYAGSSPEVLEIMPSQMTAVKEKDGPIAGELEKVEFPDMNVVNENKMMVSEYFGIPCTNLDAGRATEEDLTESSPDDEAAGVRVVESFASACSPDSIGVQKNETPASSVSTSGSADQKDKSTEGDAETSGVTADDTFAPPLINMNFQPEHSVVQQDIVDMYMKSMQEFTDSLANMKLPMDLENKTTSSNSNSSSSTIENGNSGSVPEPKKTGPKVFYGSRAFF